jgi:hypothetical protein
MKVKLVLAMLAGIMLAGCAAPSPSEMASADYGAYPDNYQEVVQNFMAATLKDPGSAQYNFIGGPMRAWNGLGGRAYGYAVCVNINAKNSYGGYVGYHLNYFLIHDGRVVKSISGSGQYTQPMAEGACRAVGAPV